MAMQKGDKCHYFDAMEDHTVDVRECENCKAPVCAKCRIDGFCLECDEIRDDKDALIDRADEMEMFYKKCHEYGV